MTSPASSGKNVNSVTNKTTFEEVVRVFRDHDSFVLAGHQDPDGDCLGSQVALALLLKRWDKTVHLVNPDPPDPVFRILPHFDWIGTELPSGLVDVGVVLDSGELSRTGSLQDYLREVDLLVNIDHHPGSYGMADVNLVDPEMSSVGEIIYRLYQHCEETVSREAAVALYVSLVTDTGSFRYANTRAESHQVAADLIRTGYIEPYRIYSALYERETFNSTLLMGRVLSRMQQDEGLVWSEVPLSLLDRTDTTPDDLQDVIKYMRRIDTCRVALLFQEQEDGTVKVKFRAKDDFNLLGVVNRLGGGGHEKAAGATLEGSLEEVRREVLEAVKDALSESAATGSS